MQEDAGIRSGKQGVKTPPAVLLWLKEYLEQNPEATNARAADWLRTEHKFSIDLTTVGRYRKRWGMPTSKEAGSALELSATDRRRLSSLLANMLVPDADDVPADPFVLAGEFFEQATRNGKFGWQWRNRRVVRCWFTPDDDRWLIDQVLGRGSGSGTVTLLETYKILQGDASKFVNDAVRYRFEAEEGFVKPLSCWLALRRSGFGGPYPEEAERAFGLVAEGPQLRGRIARFTRDLKHLAGL